jgi:hypothetical protein
MPLKKPNYFDRVGQVEQVQFDFLVNKLWNQEGNMGQEIRQRFITAPSEAALRALFIEFKIEVEADVRLAVFDVESAKVNSFVDNPSTDLFYVLVLPPRPRRNTDNVPYTTMQGWTAAHYHTINDSYGM